MATFLIKQTLRLGLDRSEFKVSDIDGELKPREIFQLTERGTLWEFLILEVRDEGPHVTLNCMNWVPVSGAFVGVRTYSRPMKATERKRYQKLLPTETT